MNTKHLLNAISLALIAAGESFRQSANECADEAQGTLELRQPADIPATDAELDSTGLPWDERIHSGNKTKNDDGRWKKRKGVADNVVDAVTAELRKTYPATAAAAPITTVAEMAAATSSVVSAPVPPAPPAFNTGFAAPPPAPVVTPYTQLCDFIAKNVGEGKALSDEWLKNAFAHNAITLPMLADDLPRSEGVLKVLRDTLASMGVAEVV